MKILSLLTPKDVERLGQIPGIAICGKFISDNDSVENFTENKEFSDFMHLIIATKGIKLKSLNDEAQKQKNGYLYIIDFRTPEGIMGSVPSEDIIGAFQIENNKLVEDSYFRNPHHKIYTKNGIVKLNPELLNLLVEELKSFSKQNNK